jgi:hypothetical protein
MHDNAGIPKHHSVPLRPQIMENEFNKGTMKKNPLRIIIGHYILRGCGPTTELLITEKRRDGRNYLTFPEGARATVGEVMWILRPVSLHLGFFMLKSGVMMRLGKIEVVEIIGDNRVEVRLLSGTFFGGTCVGKILPNMAE